MKQKHRTQADIVESFIELNKWDDVVIDQIRLPALETVFHRPAGVDDFIKYQDVRVPGLKELATGSRQEAAEKLAHIATYRGDVLSVEWKLGGDTVTVGYLENFEQESEFSSDDIVDIFANILKSRANIRRVKWDLGRPHVEVEYLSAPF